MTEDTLPQNFCTLCGETLKDYFKSTAQKHKEEKHQDILKKNAKQRKANLIAIGLMSGLVLLVMIPIIISAIDPDLGKAMNDASDKFTFQVNQKLNPKSQMMDFDTLNKCGTKVHDFKVHLYQEGRFSTLDVPTFQDLLLNCKVGFESYQYGPNMFNDTSLDVKNIPNTVK